MIMVRHMLVHASNTLLLNKISMVRKVSREFV